MPILLVRVCRVLGAVACSQVTAFANPRFVVWGGRVQSRDGYEAAQRFDAAGYPFLGVFVPSRDSTPARPKCARVWMHEGSSSAQVRRSALLFMYLWLGCIACLCVLLLLITPIYLYSVLSNCIHPKQSPVSHIHAGAAF